MKSSRELFLRSRLEDLTISTLLLLPFTVRKINKELEFFRRRWQLSYEDIATKMNNGMTDDRIKKHFINDSGNPWMIAKICKAMSLPTPEPDLLADGEIARRFKAKMEEKQWDRSMYARRLWPDLKEEPLRLYQDRLRKQLDSEKCADGYMIAIQCEFWGIPTLPPTWFLNNRDLKELAEGSKEGRQLVFTEVPK